MVHRHKLRFPIYTIFAFSLILILRPILTVNSSQRLQEKKATNFSLFLQRS